MRKIFYKIAYLIAQSKVVIFIQLLQGYFYDLKLYCRYSGTAGNDTSIKLIGKIIREYHAIEKGLTIPTPRNNFGRKVIISLCKNCEAYIKTYGYEEKQLQYALDVLSTYKKYHDMRSIPLDDDINTLIMKTLKQKQNNVEDTVAAITKESYFKHVAAPFSQFAASRASIRSYSEDEVPDEKIINALILAQTTPSLCNRQPWRAYVHTKKILIDKILEIQNGAKGFGSATNKLILITGELGVFSGYRERNQVFVNSGMYVMNILYALHHNKIAACCLSCGFSIAQEKKLRKIVNIRRSEVFIAMIACGIPPSKFMVAGSKRYSFDEVCKML